MCNRGAMECETGALPQECGKDQSMEELKQTFEGLSRLEVPENSWVKAYCVLMAAEIERRKRRSRKKVRST